MQRILWTMALGFILASYIILFSYYNSRYVSIYQFKTLSSTIQYRSTTSKNYSRYNVYSSKCKIVDFDPFSEDAKRYFKPRKYVPCRDKKLLTYIEKKVNTATLHIDNELIPSYTKNGVNCCFSYVTRKVTEKRPDDNFLLSYCQPFVDNVELTHDFVYVKCLDSEKNISVYENTHATVIIREHIRSKSRLVVSDKSNRPISLLFIGIDSLSRLQFIRGLPKTYRYVQDNGWLTLDGYNKMGDNTFPNLMAIMTGFNYTYAKKICKPEEIGGLDHCRMIWYDYRDLGYVTAYAEDEAFFSCFNYNKEGFLNPPTDYYFRPYVLATEKLLKITTLDSLRYCTGLEQYGERILNVAKEFAITMKDFPTFGLFWTNTFSHNNFSSVSGFDDKLKSFLIDLEDGGVTNTTIVVFLSDHGFRFGDIRRTETGWLEERIPFIHVSFPPWFKRKHPLEYDNFKNNYNRLSTPYDLHMTLQHILVLGGLSYKMIPASGCPGCKSLFEEVPKERSCEDAAIEPHWCTCVGYISTRLPKTVAETLGRFFLNYIQNLTMNNPKCAMYSLNAILSTRVSQKLSYTNSSFVLIQIETKPKATFETTLQYEGDISEGKYSVSGHVSRLDFYGSHSNCVSGAELEKYCYCIR